MIAPVYSAEVADARAEGRPLVALESTIITHGMPAPQNIETALQVEDTVRLEGAVPATIAVLDGRLHVGLEDAELERLAHATDVAKLSRADLAVAVSQGWTGSTTVAATMIAAHLGDIRVFATGGIGGVHQGAEDSFDVSADLRELALTPVSVVSAGARAILDLPKTLEVLETQGVPVIAIVQEAFPAFWSRDSGLPAPLRMDNAAEVARAIEARAALGLSGGHLIANPIPREAEIPRKEIEKVVAQALGEAAEQSITGKAVPPFLLDRIFHLTQGRSLQANIALVLNNARFAARIAQELSAP